MKKSSKRENIVTMKDFEKATGFHFTMNHTGKMAGFMSASTSCICNPACMARMKDESSICSKCFSAAMHKRYGALASCLERNTEVITGKLFEIDELPMINAAFFRFESFGDLSNVIQARNYLRICKRNPWTRFALWTKNPGFMAQAIKLEGKPENLNIILSSPYINTTCDASRWEFVDKTFTVWDKAGKKELEACGKSINCGSKKCMACLLCYTKNNVTEIHESLK